MRRKCISIRSGLSSGHCVRTDSAKEVMFGILFAFQPTASCREATLDRSVFRIAHLYTRRESFRMHNVKSYSRTILCKIFEYYQWLQSSCPILTCGFSPGVAGHRCQSFSKGKANVTQVRNGG